MENRILVHINTEVRLNRRWHIHDFNDDRVGVDTAAPRPSVKTWHEAKLGETLACKSGSSRK